MKNIYGILSAGLFFGVASYFFSGAVFLFLAFGVICYFIYNNSPVEDRKFILTVLAVSFLLRIFLAVFAHALNYLDGYHGISGDDLLYTVKSWALVYKWEGKPYNWVNDLAGASPKFGLNPFTWLLAVFYKFFGFHPVIGKMINCIIGTMIGWVSYLMAKEIFDRKAARITILIVAFYPSLMRWSIANLKDPLATLLFTLCVYICINFLNKRVALWKLLTFAISMLLIYYFSQTLYFILIAVAGSLAAFFRFLNIYDGRKRKLYFIAASFVVAIIVFYYFFYAKPETAIRYLYRLEEQQALTSKSDYAGYYLYPKGFMDDLNMGRLSALNVSDVVFRNTVYFMLTPFPWQMTTKERILAFPQMLLWYSLLVLSIFGFARLSMKKPEFAFLLGVLLVIGITANAMAEGNIGSAFRHRDIFTPFFVMLASTTIHDFLNDRKNRKYGK